MDINITEKEFVEIEDQKDAEGLFKFVAYEEIMTEQDKEKSIEMSLKYQVLSQHTSLVGQIKQKQKATGEIVTTKEVVQSRSDPFQQPTNVIKSQGMKTK